jgi:hypothetical protein
MLVCIISTLNEEQLAQKNFGQAAAAAPSSSST